MMRTIKTIFDSCAKKKEFVQFGANLFARTSAVYWPLKNIRR